MKQNAPRPSIGPVGACVLLQRQILCVCICRDRLCATQHLTFGVFSVRIRMQSYYTLEGLSHSHRVAMNFKCGIKAFGGAFTWGRLAQFLANWIFIYLFMKKKGFGKKTNKKKLLAGSRRLFFVYFQQLHQIKPQQEQISCLNEASPRRREVPFFP